MGIVYQETGVGIEGGPGFGTTATHPLTAHSPQQTLASARDEGGWVFSGFLLYCGLSSSTRGANFRNANPFYRTPPPGHTNPQTAPGQGPTLVQPLCGVQLVSGGPLLPLIDGSADIQIPFVVNTITQALILGGTASQVQTSYEVSGSPVITPGAYFLTIQIVDPLTSTVYTVVPRHDEFGLGIVNYTINTFAFTPAKVIQVRLVQEMTSAALLGLGGTFFGADISWIS